MSVRLAEDQSLYFSLRRHRIAEFPSFARLSMTHIIQVMMKLNEKLNSGALPGITHASCSAVLVDQPPTLTPNELASKLTKPRGFRVVFCEQERGLNMVVLNLEPYGVRHKTALSPIRLNHPPPTSSSIHNLEFASPADSRTTPQLP